MTLPPENPQQPPESEAEADGCIMIGFKVVAWIIGVALLLVALGLGTCFLG